MPRTCLPACLRWRGLRGRPPSSPLLASALRMTRSLCHSIQLPCQLVTLRPSWWLINNSSLCFNTWRVLSVSVPTPSYSGNFSKCTAIWRHQTMRRAVVRGRGRNIQKVCSGGWRKCCAGAFNAADGDSRYLVERSEAVCWHMGGGSGPTQANIWTPTPTSPCLSWTMTGTARRDYWYVRL